MEVVATAAALRLDLAGQAPSRGAAEAVTMEEVHAAFQRVEAEEAEVAGRDEMLWAEFEYAGVEAQEDGKSQRDTEGNGSGGDGATEASAHRLAMALLERCVALSEEEAKERDAAVNALDFEKDDDSNGHMDFVTAVGDSL